MIDNHCDTVSQVSFVANLFVLFACCYKFREEFLDRNGFYDSAYYVICGLKITRTSHGLVLVLSYRHLFDSCKAAR